MIKGELEIKRVEYLSTWKTNEWYFLLIYQGAISYDIVWEHWKKKNFRE